MKTILLIFSVFLVPISVFGQTDASKSESNPLLKSTNAVKLRLDSIRPISGGSYGSTYYYDSNGKNIKSGGLTIIYDSVGNIVTIKEVDKIIDEFTYDSNGQILSHLRFGTINGIWSPVSKSKYIYDSDKPTMYLYLGIYGLEMGPAEIWTSYYNGSQIQIMYGGTCEGSEDCIDTKVEFNYEGNWNLTSKISYFRWDLTKPWIETKRVEYSYDTYDNLIRVIYSQTLSDGGNSIPYRKLEFKYDNAYTYNDLYLPFMYYGLYNDYYWYWETDFINHKRVEETISLFDRELSQWKTGTTYKYYYSEHTITGIEDTPQKELMVYPNPSKDHIIFDINTNGEPSVVELYDSQGRMVLQQEIPQDNRIQVKHLHRGLYIYKLNYHNTVRTGKIVLQ